jgi:hypothetical protein
MAKRGATSPDRADAVLGAMTPIWRLGSVNLGAKGPRGSFTEQLREFNEEEGEPAVIPGAFFG